MIIYIQNAESFVKGTIFVDFKKTQDKFLKVLPGKRVLDFGCGSGRDTKYFINAGFEVFSMKSFRFVSIVNSIL